MTNTEAVGLGEQVTTSNDPNYTSFVHYREGDTPASDYSSSRLRQIEAQCIDALPSDLRNVIIGKATYTSYANLDITPVKQSDSQILWSLDVEEIIGGGKTNQNLAKYAYFKNGNHVGSPSSVDLYYWTRTPIAKNNTTNKFFYIDTGYSRVNTQYGSFNYGVVFGLRIG